MRIQNASHLHGTITIPGDKSISHRAVMFGALANGTTEITHFLQGEDCLSTIQCFRQLGISIDTTPDRILVHGKGLSGLQKPATTLDAGNSGTTTRLLAGILSGQSFESTLSGDASLNARPMGRIIRPLTEMGADITSAFQNQCAPLTIHPGNLHGIHYNSPIASAQVKSAVLLAGLYATGKTSVTEPALSRNHTELMLRSFGASIQSTIGADGVTATASIEPFPHLEGQRISVPGDISSAAYFIAAGLLVPHSEILIRNVGINPTRAGMLQVCKEMGGNISIVNQSFAGGEPTADLLVRASELHGTTIEGPLIPTLIDEIPILAVLAAYAQGTTIIRDAAELKVKETDRIQTVCTNLAAMGADVTPTEDGMIIHGTGYLHGAVLDSFLDHRIAMAFSIAALSADGETELLRSRCVDISYPAFYETLQTLSSK